MPSNTTSPSARASRARWSAATHRGTVDSDPPEWLAALQGFELFRVQQSDTGWSAYPDGVDESTEYPGGTWRVLVTMPADLSITGDHLDPLLLLVVLAHGVAKIDDKIQELVAHCRTEAKSWTQIGQALGMTKRSAWERFSGED